MSDVQTVTVVTGLVALVALRLRFSFWVSTIWGGGGAVAPESQKRGRKRKR